jgi:D-serine deaminase-like pyridoxal phosphate-dependent protein
MNLSELVTPALVLDRKILDVNISRLHERMKALGVDLRPHGKTAKNIDVIRMALAGQSGGITVSTLKEAEYYFANGITDIVYAVGIAPVKLDRICALIKKGADITVILDSIAQVRFVAKEARSQNLEIPVLIELDCDGHRSGVTLDDSLLLDIGRLAEREEGVILKGVLTHAGESYSCKSAEAIRALAAVERDVAGQAATRLRENGLPCPVVSVGSTPTANFAEDLSGVTEVRAGVFVFYDLVMAGLGVCKPGDIAVSVLASVIGHQKKKGWTITDAGWMALSRDRGTAAQKVDQGYGLVYDLDGNPVGELIVSSVNQEHGIIEPRSGTVADGERFEVGDMVRILPNHACATAAMHDRYQVVDGGTEVIDTWHRTNGW